MCLIDCIDATHGMKMISWQFICHILLTLDDTNTAKLPCNFAKFLMLSKNQKAIVLHPILMGPTCIMSLHEGVANIVMSRTGAKSQPKIGAKSQGYRTCAYNGKMFMYIGWCTHLHDGRGMGRRIGLQG